ncbi:MAG: sensor histidine kinase [Gammaproteobacteria bacterium]
MARAGSTALDGAGTPHDETLAGSATPGPAKAAAVDRLIGDQPTRWWPLAGSWLAVAFSEGFSLFVNYLNVGRPATFVSVLMAMIPHYTVWLLVSPPLYRALHMTIEGHRRAMWVGALAGWSLVALLGSTGVSFLSYALRRDVPIAFGQLYDIYFQGPAGPAFQAMNLSTLALALAAFAVVRGLRLRDHALWAAAQAELRGARLEAQLAEARLQALQAQINPHFLLNSLNAVAGLVQTGERDRAFDAIGRIGELLQVALKNGRTPDMTLGDEMEFLDRYLKLCELRFETCFRYRLAVPESLRELRIPALLVQPLIENSLRHGMVPPRLLTVEIRAWREGRQLMLEVEDDGRGPGARGIELRPGHGLANVAERLRLFYGAGGQLTLEPRAPKGTRVRLICPL